MQFLKTLFWVVVAVILVVFGANNWEPVSLRLWSDISIETKLPVLMALCFLLGLVPLFAWHRASKWSLQRKLTKIEAALAYEQTGRLPERLDNEAQDLTPAPAAAPMAVPPGVA
jgi:uncharacterized membrane protein YciS (DUF1049 family)